MGGISRAVVFGKTGHRTLLQLFDPFDFPLKAVADINGEAWVLGVEDISFGAALEGIGVSFDEVLKSGDPGIELSYLGHMVGFSLFDCFEQRLGNALEGVGVEVSAAIQDVGG